MSDPALLAAEDLVKHYPVTRGLLRREVGRVRAVDGVDLRVRRGETLGLVGESGSGKSTVARLLVGVEEPTGGEVRFEGRSVAALDRREEKAFRRRVGLVFQDPTTAFDPRMTVGEAVAEPLRIHGLTDPGRRRAVALDGLARVGLTAADAERYPHALSGGQKQRAALARALVCNPDLLVADEPVSALDVSLQAEILGLLADLRDRFDLSVLLISHDVAVVRQVADRVAVMYAGELVEVGPTEVVLEDPSHPYTEALLASVPAPDPAERGEAAALSGSVPDPADPPPGCRFHPRCPKVIQPPDLDLDQAAWRGVLDLRVDLRRGELAVDPADGEGDVRAAYAVPPRLSDPDAEAALAAALSALADGDRDGAADRLADAFPTVCAGEVPDTVTVGSDHRAACHLRDGA